MSIYQPYFYIIQEISTGMYYAGSKYGKDANPDNFMVEGGYTTSSKIINHLLEENERSTFKIRKLRVFETGKEAYEYETRFLQKVDARNNKRFYNGHNNDKIFSYQDENYKLAMLKVYGVEHPMQNKELLERSLETKLEKYGTKNNIEKNKITNLERYGVENVFQVDAVKDKIKETCLDRYGEDHFCKSDFYKGKTLEEIHGEEKALEIKVKMSETRTGEGNSMYGKNHSEESKNKISIKARERNEPLKGLSNEEIFGEEKAIEISNKIKENNADFYESRRGKNLEEIHGEEKALEIKRKLSNSSKGRKLGPSKLKGRKLGQERIEKMKSSALKRKKKECPHCGRFLDPGNYKQFHGENCKLKS